MRIFDDVSPAPTLWSFVLGHDNVSPVEQQRHWLEDTDCLELIRRKDGSIASINRISELDSVQRFILDVVKRAVIVIQQQFWMKECDILRESKHTLILPIYFQGVRTSPPQDLRPGDCHDGGSPAPTFWSFVLGHDNVSPVEQQRHWLEDTVSLELIRCMAASSA